MPTLEGAPIVPIAHGTSGAGVLVGYLCWCCLGPEHPIAHGTSGAGAGRRRARWGRGLAGYLCWCRLGPGAQCTRLWSRKARTSSGHPHLSAASLASPQRASGLLAGRA